MRYLYLLLLVIPIETNGSSQNPLVIDQSASADVITYGRGLFKQFQIGHPGVFVDSSFHSSRNAIIPGGIILAVRHKLRFSKDRSVNCLFRRQRFDSNARLLLYNVISYLSDVCVTIYLIKYVHQWHQLLGQSKR